MVATTGTTRERLIAAAQALLQEGGYGTVSVAGIGARAGVAASAMYRHFPSKAELFVEVFRSVCGREIAAMERAAEAVAATGAPGVARVEETLAVFATRALANPRLAWALLAEPVDPLVDAERLAYRQTYRALLSGLLAEAVAAGEIPAQDPDLTAAALVGAVGEALVGPLAPAAEDRPDPAALVAALRVFARRAVGSATATA
ncbi:TetR family transcriptional regulator [Conexibacter sp. W3-3-2]|uniref:TetR/AcrR family transcriptional regulator n=1 Tax=Paraconexibacter algicola TaxID=2133960 RepID=A0A2T4UDE2_9ACTN|nr:MULTISPECIES: TetR/AcrR family transcriptional regulator [Solirubrobacterales]MTD43596.1 TetR family transcriptional regulator [Conexibacter sp. W3-3-2]PTL55530.1 TetR/AcrR family transcriptional regulator [Paraconexibacter algicola]